MLWVILFFTVPFLSFIGLITVVAYIIKSFSSSNPSLSERETFLRQSLTELERVSMSSPSRTVRDQMDVYRKELAIITHNTKPVEEMQRKNSEEKKKSLLYQDLSTIKDNWYAENSISLLLYLGAFMIVASASIFVGFQWETISGVLKAFVLSCITLAFFICGVWFFKSPKLKMLA